MKTLLTAGAGLLVLCAGAIAQQAGASNRGQAATPPRSFTPVPDSGAAPAQDAKAGRDPSVKKTIELPPEPIPIENLGKPDIALPDGPIDPYLLTKEQGPFMVCAHTFRGPDATRYALALVLELRNEFRMPAYIFHLKIHPGGSNIRNVQPTAPNYVPNGDVAVPEKYRVFDEAAVLVGNVPTIDDAEKLLKQVKKIKPKTVDALPSIWGHRKGQGLYRAQITANPLIPAQNLFPGLNPEKAGALPTAAGQVFDPYVATAALAQTQKKPDDLLKRMNAGPHSIYKCSGTYTLPVAEFRGRSTANIGDPRFSNTGFLKKSPLAKAGDDAEDLAAKLAKCQLMRGYEPYVFHDRDRSVVTIGAFNGPNDPNLVRLREIIPRLIYEMLDRRMTLIPLAPSPTLMEVPRE